MRIELQKSLFVFVVLVFIFIFYACSGGSGLSGSDDSSSGNETDLSSSSVELVSGSSSAELSVSSSSQVISSSSSVLSESSSSQVVSSSSSAVSESSSSRVVSSSSSTVSVSSSSRTISSSSSVLSVSSSSVMLSTIGCSREGLENAVNSYLAAIAAGDYTLMPLTSTAKYIENDNTAKMNYMAGSYNREIPFGEGLWESPLAVDFHRNLIDVDECATFTEIIISNSNPQYIMGVSLKVSDNKISEVNAIVTQKGDWLFNAENYLRYSKGEDWSLLPVNQRQTREKLRADAFAYFEYFGDKTAEVPWGIPCARLEGGAYTGDYANSTCNVGVPDQNIQLSSISYLADVDYGMIVLRFYFGGADSHLFRILPTGYRYIHTLTAMLQSSFTP